VRSTYHADAQEIHWDTFTGDGHEFAAYIVRELRTITSVSHAITNPLIDLDGDDAFCESQYTARNTIPRDPDLGGWVDLVVWGRYLDVVERRSGVWRIAHRRLVRDGSRVQLIATQLSVPPDGTGGRLGRDDPSYLGFDVATHRMPAAGGSPGLFGSLRRFAAS
jgi:hypothetical protein